MINSSIDTKAENIKDQLDCPHVCKIDGYPDSFKVTGKYDECDMDNCEGTHLFFCFHCGLCLCLTHCTSHFKQETHPIQLDLKSMMILCFKCPILGIHPSQNIPALFLIYVTEFSKRKGKIPRSICLPAKEYKSIFKNKSPEFSYLMDTLFDLLTICGTSTKESKVEEYILKKLTSSEDSKSDDILKSDHFGILHTQTPPNGSYTILLNSHTDQVSSTMVTPIILKDKFGSCMATAFDNRVSVAVNLTLAKYCKPCNILRVMYLFDKEEEIGFNGFRYFFQDEKVKQKILNGANSKIDQLIVLDGTFGRFNARNEKTSSLCSSNLKLVSGKNYPYLKNIFDGKVDKLPVLGGGICVELEDGNVTEDMDRCKVQESGMSREEAFGKSNLRVCDEVGFRNNFGNFRAVKKGLITFPLVKMHCIDSFTSVRDIWTLYNFVKMKLLYHDNV